MRSAKGHGVILEAIRNGDAAAARRTMSDHLFVLYTEIQRKRAHRKRSRRELHDLVA